MQLHDLAIARASRVLAAGLSLVLEPGEGLELVGPNGAGKTTLLRTIAGFLPPAAGKVTLIEPGLAGELEPGELVHYVGHADAIKAGLSVRENARFWQRYLARPSAPVDAMAPPTLDDALETFGLATLADVPAGYLSAGQKRRLGLTRLALAPRPLWLLDEPSVSLDDAGRSLLSAHVDRHLDDGGIVVAATHVALGSRLARTLRLGPGTGPTLRPSAAGRGDHPVEFLS
ncbi:MAG: heme ABC exporter ATP-binding protein CcmA [Rhizobiales bacterium]|nr:heme ABC exporter ATP-binding protein CcmA [Hyphomicrobiales bacterium]